MMAVSAGRMILYIRAYDLTFLRLLLLLCCLSSFFNGTGVMIRSFTDFRFSVTACS